MKKILLISVLATSNVYANSTYETTLDAIQATCPSCERSLRLVSESLNKKCGFPLTPENLQYIGRSHPMYAFSIALSALSGDKESLNTVYQAIEKTASCWNADQWIADTKEVLETEKLTDTDYQEPLSVSQFKSVMDRLEIEMAENPNSDLAGLYKEGFELVQSYSISVAKNINTSDIELKMTDFLNKISL
jgi:hypothetical protein